MNYRKFGKSALSFLLAFVMVLQPIASLWLAEPAYAETTQHTVKIRFYDYDKTTPVETTGENVGNKYYAFVKVTEKDGDKEDVAYEIKQLPSFNNIQKNGDVTELSFDIGAWDQFTEFEGKTYVRDFDQYNMSVRIFQFEGGYPEYSDIIDETDGHFIGNSNIDGFIFDSNTPGSGSTPTVMVVHKADERQLNVKFHYDDTPTAISESDNYYLLVKVTHQTGNPTYYYEPLTTDGTNDYTVPITKWQSGSGMDLPHEQFTGNETGVTVTVIKSKSRVGINQILNADGTINTSKVEQIAVGGNVKEFKVDSYTTDTAPSELDRTDPVDHLIKFFAEVDLSKISTEKALTPTDILGEAAEYGITANRYVQTGHTETNFAVNELNMNENIDIDGSGDGIMPFRVADIDDGTKLWLSAGTNVNADIYVGENSEDQVNVTSTKETTVIPQPEATINRYVNKLIQDGKDKSTEMAAKTTIKPEFTGTGYTLDTTAFPDGTTIYVDADGIMDSIAAGGWYINKLEHQSIVFNISQESKVTLGEFYVCPNDDTDGSKYHDKEADGKYWVQSTTAALNQNNERNERVDNVIFEHITFNVINASEVHLENASGLFLLPEADHVTQSNGAGWILAKGTVESGAEWHFYRHKRNYKAKGLFILKAEKKLQDKDGNPIPYEDKDFEFELFQTEDDSFSVASDAEPLYEVTADENGSVEFSKINYTSDDVHEGETQDFYYLIREKKPADDKQAAGVNYTGADSENDIKIHVVVTAPVVEGQEDVDTDLEIHIYKVTGSGEEKTETELSGTGADEDIFQIGDFINKYTEQDVEAQLKVKKQVEGNPESDSTFTFELTPANNNAKDGSKVKFAYASETGKATEKQTVTVTGSAEEVFKKFAYSEAGEYKYTITEVKGSEDNYEYDQSSYDVTVTVSKKSAPNPDNELEETPVISIQKKNKSGENVGDASADVNDIIFVNKYAKNELVVKKVWKNASGQELDGYTKNRSVKFKLIQTATPVEEDTPDLGDAVPVKVYFVKDNSITNAAVELDEQLKIGTVLTIVIHNPASNTNSPTVKKAESDVRDKWYNGAEELSLNKEGNDYTLEYTIDGSVEIGVTGNNWSSDDTTLDISYTDQSSSSDEPLEPTSHYYPSDDNPTEYELKSADSPAWEKHFDIVQTADADDESKLPLTGTVDGRPVTYTYKIEEISVDGEAVTDAEYSENNANGITKGTLSMINTVTEEDKGSLKVEKDLTGAPAGSEDKVFSVTVKNEEGKYLNAAGTVSDEEVILSVSKSAPLTISDIPVGSYTVTEKADGRDIAKYSIDTANSTTEKTVTVGKGATVTAGLINAYTQDKGSLKVKKNVTVNGESTEGTEADGTYFFNITGPEDYSETKELTVVDGASSELTVEDLVPGTYTVTEVAPVNGTELVGVNGIVVEVTPNNTADVPTAEFTNNKEVFAELRLTKEIDKYFDAGDKTNATMVFTVSYEEDGKTVERNVNIKYDAESDAAQTAVLKDIPLDAELTVKETYSGNYKPDEKVKTLTNDDLKQDKDGNWYYAVSFMNRLVGTNSEKGIINKYSKDADGSFVIRERVGADD